MSLGPRIVGRSLPAVSIAALRALSSAGVSFGTPAQLNDDAASDTKYDQAPVIATDGAGHWVAAWVASKLPTGPATDPGLQRPSQRA
jgi:hypothetical protein